MSSSPPSLNDDVLLHIFDLNADMFNDDDTLITARVTSQVCRHWRSMMLETPFLWAKLIDMDELSLIRTGHWRNELIRRSGDAPLWILAELPWSEEAYNEERGPYDRNMQRFFNEVIAKNWHRIEKLVLCHLSAFELTQSMLRCPAPLLKHIEAAAPIFDFPASVPLFSNQAPMLRNIHLGRNLVDYRASWLCRLLSIKLDKTYSLSDALAILSRTRHLQELDIMDIAAGNKEISLPLVSLSRLQDLTYCVNDSNAGVTLLDHMSIPIGCSLSIHFESCSKNARYAYKNPSILSIIDHFVRHAQPSLKLQTFDGIYLDLVQDSYISWKCRATFSVKPFLEISVPFCGDSDTNLLQLFLLKLLPLHFTTPTYLKITAHAESISHFGLFLHRLSTMDTIYTDLQTLSHLADLQNAVTSEATETPSVIFPMLKAIILFGHRKAPRGISFIDKIAATFLIPRLQASIPVTTLDISQTEHLDLRPYFQALEEINGLTVLYRLKGREEIIEYTCGARTEKIFQSDLVYKPIWW